MIILESVKANLRKNSTDSIEVYLNFSKLSWEHLNFNELLEWEKIYKRPSQEKNNLDPSKNYTVWISDQPINLKTNS